jgi:hypothetical protein
LCHLASDVSLGFFKTSKLFVQGLHTLFGVFFTRRALALQRHHVGTQRLQIILPHTANNATKKKNTAQHKQSFHDVKYPIGQ